MRMRHQQTGAWFGADGVRILVIKLDESVLQNN
jgi:hypothetical protein